MVAYSTEGLWSQLFSHVKGLNETDTFIRHSHQAALRCEWDDLHRVVINSFSIWMVSSTAEQEENVKEKMSVGVRDGEKERERECRM